MKIKYFILLIICVPLGTFAQDSNTEEQHRKPKKEKTKKEKAKKIKPEEALEILNNQFLELQKEYEQLKKDYDTLYTQDSIQQADILAQEEARQQLDAYYQHCRKNLYQEYADYLDAPFSTITLQKINSIREFVTRYLDIDTNAQTLLTRADSCIKHKQGYDRMAVMLSQPLDAKRNRSIRDSIKTYIELGNAEKWSELGMSEKQWKEIDDIDLYFSRYQPGVRWLQKVMKKCEDQYKSDGLSANSIADVGMSKRIRQDIINNEDKRQIDGIRRNVSPEGNIADYILIIPWLCEQYKNFISEPNPLNPSQETRKAIEEVMKLGL